jgi:hypothetical protein
MTAPAPLRRIPVLATLATAALLAACEHEASHETTVEASAGASASPPGPAPTGQPSTPSTAQAEPLTGAAALEALRANAAATAERAEHQAATVEVTHILVSFGGAGTKATRTREEAETLAAELFARVQAGEDFEALRVPNTDDPGGQSYVMSLGNEARAIPRKRMVPAFGDVGWRLEVGQVGVAPYDEHASPYGWHIIKRLK